MKPIDKFYFMNKIFSIFNLSFCLSFSGLVHGQVEEVAKEKSYSEKIKEAYEKGVKGAKEEYAETLEMEKTLQVNQKNGYLRILKILATGNIKFNLSVQSNRKRLKKN